MKNLSQVGRNARADIALAVAVASVFTLLLILVPRPAQAEPRVAARLRLPSVDVRVVSGAHRSRLSVRPVRRPVPVVLTRLDGRVAKVLAKRTGYRRNVLMDLRRAGLNWYRIGARLDIPSGIVRVSLATARRMEPAPRRGVVGHRHSRGCACGYR